MPTGFSKKSNSPALLGLACCPSAERRESSLLLPVALCCVIGSRAAAGSSEAPHDRVSADAHRCGCGSGRWDLPVLGFCSVPAARAQFLVDSRWVLVASSAAHGSAQRCTGESPSRPVTAQPSPRSHSSNTAASTTAPAPSTQHTHTHPPAYHHLHHHPHHHPHHHRCAVVGYSVARYQVPTSTALRRPSQTPTRTSPTLLSSPHARHNFPARYHASLTLGIATLLPPTRDNH